MNLPLFINVEAYLLHALLDEDKSRNPSLDVISSFLRKATLGSKESPIFMEEISCFCENTDVLLTQVLLHRATLPGINLYLFHRKSIILILKLFKC